MAQKTALIFAGGEIESISAARSVAKQGDFRIAADGGLRHALALGVLPDALIGDLDSVSPADLSAAENAGVRILRYPVEKDDTDLELALQLALDEGYTRVRLLGTLGGRVDHLLGNLFLLARPDLSGLDVRIDEGGQEIFIIDRETVIAGHPGDLVSLLPFGGEARGVETEDLYYPLRGETLYPYHTRGVSNVMLAARAVVRLAAGRLLCVHIRKSGGHSPASTGEGK